MRESGSTQFPRAPQTPEHRETTRDEKSRTVELVRISDDIREAEIRGKVEHVDRAERRVSIRTERGDVEVQYPQNQPLPKDGDHVEIKIQDDQKVTVKTVPPPETPEAQARSTATPVDVMISNSGYVSDKSRQSYAPPNISEASIKSLPQYLPPAGSTVRITPIATQDLMHVLEPLQIETLPQNITEQVTFEANLIVQSTKIEMQHEIVSESLTTPKPAPALLDAISRLTEETPLVTKMLLPETLQQTPLLSQSPALPVAKTVETPISLSLPEPKAKLPAFTFFSLPISLPGVSAANSNPKTLPMNTAAPLSVLPVSFSTLESSAQNLSPTPALSMPLQSMDASMEAQIFSTQTPKTMPVRLENFDLPKVSFDLPKHLALEQAKPMPLEELITQGGRAEVIQARIEGMTKEHLPVLSMMDFTTGEMQYFTLQAPVESATPGEVIELMPQNIVASAMSGVALVPPMNSFLTPGAWPLMQEVAASLQASAPQLAQALSNLTPNPSNPAQITPAALFFIAAVRAGDIGGWLGSKAMDVLRREGKSRLLSRLSQEGSLMNRTSSEPISQDWRAIPLPMAWDNEMQKITLYYRHEGGDGDDQKKKGSQTRFVFDMDLSRMGAVQVDGLFREARLDIILRTGTPLSSAMREKMRKTYADALRQTQVTGELSFQNQPDQWVKITPDEKSGEAVVA